MKHPQIILELGHDIVGSEIKPMLKVRIENAIPDEVVQILKLFFTEYVQHSIAMNAAFDGVVIAETSKMPMFESEFDKPEEGGAS